MSQETASLNYPPYIAGERDYEMDKEQRTEEKIMSEDEVKAMRTEIAAEIDAEESGEKAPEPVKKPGKEELETKKDETKIEPDIEKDPWAGVDPTLRKAFDEMSAKMKDLDEVGYRLKQTESRIGALQNQLHEAKKVAEEIKVAPTKEEIEKAVTDETSWSELKEEFPEWATAIDARLAKASSSFKTEQDKIKDSQATTTKQIEDKIVKLQELTETFEKSLLEFKHPDWEKTISTPEYQGWILKQPEETKKLTTSKFAKDAVKVLNEFAKITETQNNKSPAEIAAERKQRLKQAVSVDGKKTKPAKSEADMDEEELRKKLALEVWAE